MYTSDIVRNFNAEEYRDSGYIKAISPTDDGIIVKRVGSQDILKQISKVEVNYFSNDWIDTSAISMIDFGDVFELFLSPYSLIGYPTLNRFWIFHDFFITIFKN